MELLKFLKEMLQGIDYTDIEVTDYAKRRAGWRQIQIDQVYNDLLCPVRLIWAQKQIIGNEKRFNCCFTYQKNRKYRCIIKFENHKVKIINVIKT